MRFPLLEEQLEDLLAEVTKWVDPKDAEVQQMFARLNVRPAPASYAVTDEGGMLLHELRLPVGEPVELFLRSTDVIHSFWVPNLAGPAHLQGCCRRHVPSAEASWSRFTTVAVPLQKLSTARGPSHKWSHYGHKA